MGLPLFCWTAAPTPDATATPPHPILTSATTPTLSLHAGPWLTRRAEGSGSGQQTPSQMEGCPEELMPERRKRPRDPSDVPQIFQRGRGCSVYRIFNSRREGVMHGLMYDERAEWCINKCNKNRSKSLISVRDQRGNLKKELWGSNLLFSWVLCLYYSYFSTSEEEQTQKVTFIYT